jgi:hypothetical protein
MPQTLQSITKIDTKTDWGWGSGCFSALPIEQFRSFKTEALHAGTNLGPFLGNKARPIGLA